MIVTHLSLRDFRNYVEADVALHAGTNIFVGRNGQGKTNLIESLVFLSTLGSHRVSTDRALIRAGCPSAVIRTRLHHAGRELLAEVQINAGSANRAQVNRGSIKPRELPRYIRSVLFAPEDLSIVRGEPGFRRRFLDQLITTLIPRMAGVMADYERVVRQRNTLLKSLRGVRSGTASATLEVWNDKLVLLGSEIISERLALIDALRAPLRAAYGQVVGDDHRPDIAAVLTAWGHNADDEEALVAAGGPDSLVSIEEISRNFRARLEERSAAERDRGVTLVGPHRDDLYCSLNGLPVKGYASHGESWSFALSLKLASAEILRRDSSLGDPVIILDDVFAELDSNRRGRLADAISGFEQVLITAAVAEDIPDSLGHRAVRIDAGRILDEEYVAETGHE